MARKQPSSTDEQKVEYLQKHKEELSTVPRGQLPAVCCRIGHEMKEAGLYSQKTYIVDIAHGLMKRIEALGWRVVKK